MIRRTIDSFLCRLTSSGSSIDERDLSKGDISNSFDLSYDSSVFSETSPAPKSYTPADTEPVHSDRLPAMRLLHANKDGRLAPSTMEILAGEGLSCGPYSGDIIFSHVYWRFWHIQSAEEFLKTCCAHSIGLCLSYLNLSDNGLKILPTLSL